MNRTVLVTGAAGGIGQALSGAFLKAGDRVIALDHPKAISAIQSTPRLQTIPFDLAELAKSEDTLNLTRQLFYDLVPEGIDCLVNNAAVQCLGPALTLSLTDWQKSMDVNVTAPFRLVQVLGASLETVINVTSVHATATKKEFSAYATSKAALDGLTRSLALDLGPKTRVVGLAPAAVATPMLEAGFKGHCEARADLEAAHPLARIADPDEIARAAIFLAGPDAAFMTGQTLTLDGGVLSRLYDPA